MTALIEPVVSCTARPRRASGVEVRRRADDGAIILSRDGRYVAVSPRSLEIWNAFDGVTDLRELSDRYRTGGADATAAIVALTRTLADCGLVLLDAEAAVSPTRNALRLDALAAATLLEGYVTFSPQQAIDSLYRAVRHVFHPAALAAGALVAGTGFAAFLLAQQRPIFQPSFTAFAFLGLAICVWVCAHEAAHGLMLRHFGGAVSRAGIGWYWFTPTAFVDTSDAHLLTRGRRIAVCVAGPAVDIVVAGSAALVAAGAHNTAVSACGLTLASMTYVAFLNNLNPLLETDGYYALTDLLQRPNLRRDGFAQLLGTRAAFDGIGLAYAAAAIVYAAAFVVFGVPAFIRATFAVWLGPIFPPAVIAMMPLVASIVAASLIVTAIVATARSPRFRQIGSVEAPPDRSDKVSRCNI